MQLFEEERVKSILIFLRGGSKWNMSPATKKYYDFSVAIHLRQCGTTVDNENVDFLGYSYRGEVYLMTLEALKMIGKVEGLLK